MKIETWGEETEKKKPITLGELEKKKNKTQQEKKLLQNIRALGKERKRAFKPSISFRVSPYIQSIFPAVVLFGIVAGSLYFMKTIIIDDLLITEDFAEIYGISTSLVNLMWWFIIFTLPFYFVSKMFMRGSRGHDW